jgi:enoyl-CoA hydratase/carnithine racemase
MADEKEVVSERHGNVLVLRINRPEARNSLNPPVMAGIGAGLIEAETNPEIRAIVLTGTGDRAFCGGMDLAAFASGNMGGGGDIDAAGMARFQPFMSKGECSVPVIGAANATAVAGGFELLMACDMIVAAEGSKFGLPEVKRGLFAAGGGMFLAKRIPLAKALELTLTGDYIEAEEAVALGLVNKVVPADKVLDAALELAGKIAANGPLGVAATKELVRMAANKPADEVWKVHAERQATVFASEDAREGSMAFIEKRDPVWQGK